MHCAVGGGKGDGADGVRMAVRGCETQHPTLSASGWV